MHQTKQHLWNKIKWFNINEHQTETTEIQWVDAGNLVCLTTFSNEVWIHGDCKLYRCHRKFPSCCIKTPPSRAGRISVHAWASCSWERKDENALVVLNLYTWQSDHNDVKNNKKKPNILYYWHFIFLMSLVPLGISIFTFVSINKDELLSRVFIHPELPSSTITPLLISTPCCFIHWSQST